jgi:hypothetical protein
MAKRGTEPLEPGAEHRAWRARCLVNAGFTTSQSRWLAADDRVDVHALLELVDRGCPPVLAARILAPLEG